MAIEKLNVVNVSKLSITNLRLEENSRADRRVNEPSRFLIQFQKEGNKQRKFRKETLRCHIVGNDKNSRT